MLSIFRQLSLTHWFWRFKRCQDGTAACSWAGAYLSSRPGWVTSAWTWKSDLRLLTAPTGVHSQWAQSLPVSLWTKTSLLKPELLHVCRCIPLKILIYCHFSYSYCTFLWIYMYCKCFLCSVLIVVPYIYIIYICIQNISISISIFFKVFFIVVPFIVYNWVNLTDLHKSKFLVCLKHPGNKPYSDSDSDSGYEKQPYSIITCFKYIMSCNHVLLDLC